MSQIVQATQASPTSQAAITPGAKRKLRNRVGLGQTIRDTGIMAYRGLLKIRRTPEQLFDVIFQPIIFTLLFSQIFGGAIAGNVQSYLPILVPGLLAQTVLTTTSVTGTQLREDMDKGVFDRFKSLPIARIAPLAGALLTDTVRYLIATTLTFATGFALGYNHWSARGGRAHDRLRLGVELGLRAAGRDLADRVERAGAFPPDSPPAHVLLERLCVGQDDARLAADAREFEPCHAPNHSRARPRREKRHQRRYVVGAAGCGDHRGCLRAADRAPLHAQGVSRFLAYCRDRARCCAGEARLPDSQASGA
jgi:ABC-2 family transporter